MKRTLYICYFGVGEPLVQTQVLPYLREIRKDGIGVSLLTFEPKRADADRARFAEVAIELAGEGIEWHWLAYHKRLSVLATLWDILCGAWFIRGFIKGKRPDVLHARVHVPAAMAAIARVLSGQRPKLLFDIRGFMPEEYADAGVWPQGGMLFRAVKRVERRLIYASDAFVVLTECAREVLFPESKETGFDKAGRPVEVIPCCVDFERRFSGDHDALRAEYRKRLGIEGRYVIVHLGALGGLYLVNEIADLLAAARQRNPATFALFLTQSDPGLIEPLLSERGFTADDLFIGRVDPADVEGYLHASDVGLSIVKASFATLSRSPTKIPEYLACGLPLIANAGVGDVDELVIDNGIGALLTDLGPAQFMEALSEVESLGDTADKCREAARREFDLENVGGMKYRRLYSRLLG